METMKASELRIGNYYNEFGIPKQVTAELILKLAQIEANGRIAIDVSPIDLTEEWLLKFGHKQVGDGYYGTMFNGQLITIRFDGVFYFTLNIFTRIDLKYVHTYQNLYFALTNEELNLNHEDVN